MKFINYLQEKWLTYIFILLTFLFSLVVYRLDQGFNITKSNANYIMTGWILLFLFFIAFDYIIFNTRVKHFKKYCRLHASLEESEEFSYPVDREYGTLVHNLVIEFEEYKGDVLSKSAEELEFITKWVHDVKVPIAALRLILENHEVALPKEFYQSIDIELNTIEESIQRVFYEIKTNTLHDDYKLARVSTKKLISQALKGYSSFFSYKKINITLDGENWDVLTDEKWSGYILSQIISNAVKYTPYEGTIAITTSQNVNETIITVKNSGIGILSQDIGQIFNKGYTSSENRSGVKSTGYGLYLSKKLSDLLGHHLTVESKYGEYALFRLAFKENETLHKVTKM